MDNEVNNQPASETAEFDKVVGINLVEEMRQDYIDYAMSVIVARALPDVRDGLKPVHRRILYAMHELGLDPGKPYRKSAKIVGDTMGKYHPHGDSSIYYAMVRLAQDFNTRYPLVDGHGNFGSVDGDGAAAPRYTEARMSRISLEMLTDIEKNTVDFAPNYDETEREPVVLPSRIPNLLLNGATGIAVGMATNIPPHNLGEVIGAVVRIIDNRVNEDRDTDIEELMQLIPGPDFPTGGNLLGRSGIRAAYRTGRGKLLVRGEAEIVPHERGRDAIVITEIPYGVNKARLVEKIAELARDKRIEGIADIRDESDRTGMRIVIEIKKEANANVILNQLYAYTSLQESFGVIMLALVNGKPEILTLKQMLDEYLKHQESVVTRRTQFDLDKALRRAHILEGLRIALDHIDEVIKTIRESYDNAKENLMAKFGLSEIQAQAILDMQLRRLQGLEHEKIEKEYQELMEKIAYYRAILADEKLLLGVIKDELSAIAAKNADPRRTRIVANPGEIDIEDLIEEEMDVFTLSSLNYIKRTPLDAYRSQNRGGRGVQGMATREEDFVKDIFLASTHDNLLFFTDRGRVFQLKGYAVPEAGRNARGGAIVNLLELSPGEDLTAGIPLRSFDADHYLVMITREGVVKKTPLQSFGNIRKGGLLALSLRDEDRLVSVFVTDGSKDIFVSTRQGRGIRFPEADVRPMGRQASGVRAIRLREGDYVVSAGVLADEDDLLNVTVNGFGKRTTGAAFSLQGRGGQGNKIHNLTERTGELLCSLPVQADQELMLMTSEGVIIRLRVDDISQVGRISQGVKLVSLPEDATVVGAARIDAAYADGEETALPEEAVAADEAEAEAAPEE